MKSTDWPAAPSSHGGAKPATLSGGIACRALVGTAPTAYAFQDVTLLLYTDRVAIREGDSFGPLLFSANLARCVLSVSTANTRRGIALEIGPAAGEKDVESDVIPPGDIVKALQLSFASSEDRAQAFALLTAQWERARMLTKTAAAPPSSKSPATSSGARWQRSAADPMSSGPASAWDQTNPQRPSSATTTALSADAAGVLQRVQSLRSRTDVLLRAVRQQADATDSDGEAQDGAASAATLTRERLERHLEQQKRRDGTDSAAAELAKIQARRAARQQDIQRLSPSVGAALARDIPLALLSDWQAAAYKASTAPAATECRHCREVFTNAAKREDHQASCGYRRVRCTACRTEMRARDIVDHRRFECVYAVADDDVAQRGSRTAGRSTDIITSPLSQRSVSGSSSSSFASIDAPGSSSAPRRLDTSGGSDDSMSRREREKLRVRRVLAKQAAERAATPPSSSASAAGVRSRGDAGGGSSDDLVRCPHCRKDRPSSHQSKCAHRIVRCNRCGTNMPAGQAKDHAAQCPARRK